MKSAIPIELQRELQDLRRLVDEVRKRVGNVDLIGTTPHDAEGEISSFRVIKTEQNQYGLGLRTRDGWVTIGAQQTSPVGTLTPPITESILGTGIVTVTADYVVGTDDTIVLVKPDTTNLYITLPTITVTNEIIIKKASNGSGKVYIMGTIDGEDRYELTIPYNFVRLISDGTQWYVIGNN